MNLRIVLVAPVLLAVAGCTVGPKAEPPQARVAEAWSQPLPSGLAADPADLSAWWTTFNDPVLTSLIDRAIATNLDLRAATSRVREARAARGLVTADRLPAVEARGSASLRHSSDTSNGGPGGAPGDTNDSYDVGFDATWELDLFGRVRRSVDAADADLAASVESLRDARVVLVAEVARAYVDLRSAQARLDIARQNARVQQQTLDLSAERRRAGLGTDLDVARARAQLETIHAQIPPFETARQQAQHRLDVLLGQLPGTLAAELDAPSPVPSSPDALAVGLPADLLRRRPDIRRAERQLAAAAARVGVATADLYPRFTLSGSFGLESGELGTLFEARSNAWSVGPLSVRWPIFDGGRVRAALRVQEARQELACLAYEAAVLASHQDVADALVAYAQVRTRRDTLARALQADRQAVDLASDLWSRGLTGFLDVLDAQRALFLVQDQLAAADAEAATSLIALYKALGGGWEAPQTAAASP
ncbi:MAG: RND transporter [Phycisphaerae bacterium]|nr:MAG: RND transporter [Phycisphaerae bacterium]